MNTKVDTEALLVAAIRTGQTVNIWGDVRLTNGLVVALLHISRPCIFCAYKTTGRVILVTWSGEIKRADVVCPLCNAALPLELNGQLVSILKLATAGAARGRYHPVEVVVEAVVEASKPHLPPGRVSDTAQFVSDIDDLLAAVTGT